MIQFRDPNAPLTEAQRELRKNVLKQIENEPASFRMDRWERRIPLFENGKIKTPECHTTRCIEGWAEFLSVGSVMKYASDPAHVEIGVKLLGLTNDEYYDDESVGLFFDTDDSALARMRKLAYGE